MVARAGAKLGGARAGGRGVAGAVVCSAGLGRVIGERYDTDATAGVGAGDPWYYKAYDGFSRHVATFRGGDASPKEIYTHHEMNDGGSQLAVRRDVDATGGGGWGGGSDGVLETTTYMLHRANGDVIAVVGALTVDGVYPNEVRRPGLLRERMDYVPGGDGAEPMRFSPSDGYQIGGEGGADGYLTGDDYNAFIADFAAGTANGSTDLNNNGVVDGRDFAAWNAEWDSGAAVGRAVLSAADGLDAKGPGNVRGRSADAGVALDAQLSGKVTGADGETGRVRWAAVGDGVDDVAIPGGGGGSASTSPGVPRNGRNMPFPPCGVADRENQCRWWARNQCGRLNGPLVCYQKCVDEATSCCMKENCADPISGLKCGWEGAQAMDKCKTDIRDAFVPLPTGPVINDCSTVCNMFNAVIAAICKTCAFLWIGKWKDYFRCAADLRGGQFGCENCCQADGVKRPASRSCIEQMMIALNEMMISCVLDGALDAIKDAAYKKQMCEIWDRFFPDVICPLEFK